MVYFALANKAKPPMTIAETHGRPTRGINAAVFLGPGRTPKRRSRSLRPPGEVMIAACCRWPRVLPTTLVPGSAVVLQRALTRLAQHRGAGARAAAPSIC